MPRTLEATFENIRLEALLYKADKPTDKPLLFCLPGGGAARGFFDLAPDYSFADRMMAKGFDVITMDHPGTGTNLLPENHGFLSPRVSADYINWALSSFIDAEWPAQAEMTEREVIGIGHSMGGMMATLVQGRHRPFKAMALLGSSAGGLDWGLSEDELKYKNREADIARDLKALTLAKFGAEFPGSPGGGPSGKSILFGGETEELTEDLRQNTCKLFAAGGMMSMLRGSFKTEVESLDIPLFFAFGDHDLGIPPKDVPKDYVNAPSTQLMILENTGHNHMAFSSIGGLTDAIGDWVAGVKGIRL
ncbi:MAG: alpha/beta hydrolase [Hellea sp.]|nr:alpha/beta hydrolase [Hellea sp.]